MKLVSIPVLAALCIWASSSFAFQMIGESNTQATGSSCQSYSFAIMLTLKDERYGGTAKALNETETAIRALVVKHGGTSGSHEAWDKAIAEFTKNKYKLRRAYVNNYSEWTSRIRDLTTPTIDDIMILKFERAVATSVHSIDGSNYSSGHIITIVGIDDAIMNNKITYLNGGIKPQGDKGFSDHICRPNSYGSKKYVVGIRQSNDYELKGNGVYWIE